MQMQAVRNQSNKLTKIEGLKMTNSQKTETIVNLSDDQLCEVSGGNPLAAAALVISAGTALFTYGRYLHSQNCNDH